MREGNEMRERGEREEARAGGDLRAGGGVRVDGAGVGQGIHLDSGPTDSRPLCGASDQAETTTDINFVTCDECYELHEQGMGGDGMVEGTTARFVGLIIGIDDAGPYEIFGGDSDESDDTPEAAFHYAYGFWDEVDLTEVRSPHIRVWDLVADELAYIWEPENPGILAGFYTDDEIEVQI